MVRKRAIARWRLTELLRERLLADLMDREGASEKLESLSRDIADKTSDPYSAVEQMLSATE